MKGISLIVFFVALSTFSSAQSTFNGGWHIYKTGSLTRQYTYAYDFVKDSARLTLTDSVQLFASPDSSVTLTIDYPTREKNIYKTTNYIGKNKQVYKSEHYKGNAMQSVEEWRYDTKNRLIYQMENTKQNGRTYLKTYTYAPDKTTGGQIITENSYYNGKIEFYTLDYYDRKNRKYKEVRLNDNKSATVHVESYIYSEDGRLKQRQVYFPEFRVTKKFDEGNDGNYPKCYKVLPISYQAVNAANKTSFLKKELWVYKAALTDKDCKALEYTLSNKYYKIQITRSKADNKQVAVLTLFDAHSLDTPPVKKR